MVENIINFNEKEIGKCYQFLNHNYETEIRLIDPNKKNPPKSIFIHSEEEFVKNCKNYNGNYNIYAGINERKPNGDSGNDVISVKTIVIDIDSKKEKGYEKESATEEELMGAKEDCDNILDGIKKTKHPEPTKLFSGNGYQIWISIPTIKITDENRKKIQTKIQ